VYPVGHDTGHFDTGSLGFSVSLSKWWDSSQVPACFSCSLSDAPFLSKPPDYFSKLHNLTLIQKIKTPRPLSQATTSNHSDVFTFILPLPKRLPGEAWEPSNKTMLFLFFIPPPPTMRPLTTSVMTFDFHLLFCCTFFLSLFSTHRSPRGPGWDAWEFCVQIQRANSALITTILNDGDTGSIWNFDTHSHGWSPEKSSLWSLFNR
jgi:hypothetical protein